MKNFKSVQILSLAVVLCGSLFLTACVDNEKYSYQSKELNGKNSALIVGEIADSTGYLTTLVRFTNISTHETITYNEAKIFFFRATPGKYSVEKIGGRGLDYTSKSPFSFEVKAGEKLYIGTIFNQLDPSADVANQAVSKKYDGARVEIEGKSLTHKIGSAITLCVADNSVKLKEALKNKMSDLAVDEFQVRLMN